MVFYIDQIVPGFVVYYLNNEGLGHVRFALQATVSDAFELEYFEHSLAKWESFKAKLRLGIFIFEWKVNSWSIVNQGVDVVKDKDRNAASKNIWAPYCKSLAFSRPGDEKKQSIMRHKISSREKKEKQEKLQA